MWSGGLLFKIILLGYLGYHVRAGIIFQGNLIWRLGALCVQGGWSGENFVFFRIHKKQLPKIHLLLFCCEPKNNQNFYCTYGIILLIMFMGYAIQKLKKSFVPSLFFLAIKTLFIFCLWINNPRTPGRSFFKIILLGYMGYYVRVT